MEKIVSGKVDYIHGGINKYIYDDSVKLVDGGKLYRTTPGQEESGIAPYSFIYVGV